MRYRVAARIIEDQMDRFWEKLTDGTIQRQKPDGEEIIASMRRARITSPGLVEWYETCFCPTPLAHEKETVYDQFFVEMRIQEVTSELSIKGESFWDYLEALGQGPRR